MLQGDRRRGGAFEYREQVALSPDVIAFTVHIGARGFACLGLELLLLSVLPAKAGSLSLASPARAEAARTDEPQP